jgi:hypothetical protein
MTSPSNSPQCIITGCTFYTERGGFALHGDLWTLEDVYIFNAVGDNEYVGWPPLQTVRAIIAHGDFFHRRNVLVISHHTSSLTTAAKEYIRA